MNLKNHIVIKTMFINTESEAISVGDPETTDAGVIAAPIAVIVALASIVIVVVIVRYVFYDFIHLNNILLIFGLFYLKCIYHFVVLISLRP